MTSHSYLMEHGKLASHGRLKLFSEPLSHLLYADDLVLVSTSKRGNDQLNVRTQKLP